VQGEPGNPGARGALPGVSGFPCVLILILTFTFGRWSGVVVPDLAISLFEGMMSGTSETERNRPPARGDLHFHAGMGVHSARTRGVTGARGCPAAARPVLGRSGLPPRPPMNWGRVVSVVMREVSPAPSAACPLPLDDQASGWAGEEALGECGLPGAACRGGQRALLRKLSAIADIFRLDDYAKTR